MLIAALTLSLLAQELQAPVPGSGSDVPSADTMGENCVFAGIGTLLSGASFVAAIILSTSVFKDSSNEMRTGILIGVGVGLTGLVNWIAAHKYGWAVRPKTGVLAALAGLATGLAAAGITYLLEDRAKDPHGQNMAIGLILGFAVGSPVSLMIIDAQDRGK